MEFINGLIHGQLGFFHLYKWSETGLCNIYLHLDWIFQFDGADNMLLMVQKSQTTTWDVIIKLRKQQDFNYQTGEFSGFLVA